jgi:hypothetical protein
MFPNCTFVEVPDSHTFVPLDNPGAVVHAVERASAR